MADASHDELIVQFTSVTGADAERAKFYLESAAWSLDVAMASFYEEDDDGGEDMAMPESMRSSTPPTDLNNQNSGVASAPVRGPDRGRIATLMNTKPGDSDSDDDHQAFYTGGSEHGGGQQILGPRKKVGGEEVVKEMFKAAKEHGAEVVDRTEASAPARSRAPAFVGTGYRLGDTEDTPPVAVRSGAVGMPSQRQVDMTLKLWRNGFSIDDGPLRDFVDESNAEFLDAVKRGEVPRELIRQAKGGEVNLNMEDHRQEEFVAPRVKVKAFSGAGNMLGSAVPNIVTNAAASSEEAQKQNEASAQTAVNVDTSKPTTSLQIRLADGSRLVSKFNHTNRVADIRQFIITARPEYANVHFVLLTTFPNRELTDEAQTLEAGKLLNAVIMQRVK
ncbi:NSFL1 cofactor p47 [Lamellibrachia satsuma]|nr:NSFL1 cofactor p47 [Lamellibrachia satsuma]